MKVLNFGSLNLDHIYRLDHFVKAGETESSFAVEIKAGGKGLNQSVALARAGLAVYHAGCVGKGGESLKTLLEENGVNTQYLQETDELQGTAVIQVVPSGENAIILFAGSNACVTPEQASAVLEDFGEGDILLLQNEISALPQIIHAAHAKGMKIILNPSPYNQVIEELDLSLLSWIFINKTEAYALCAETETDRIFSSIHERYPQLSVLLTLGAGGSAVMRIQDGTPVYFTAEAYAVNAVDTTAAGDTYTGYFIASLLQGCSTPEAMRRAGIASGIACTREGAAPSIPYAEEVNRVYAEISHD
ncbi:MAG: ribokinase [Solobacterium sp.]|nr:ribokinase [Solobacterium sp.]